MDIIILVELLKEVFHLEQPYSENLGFQIIPDLVYKWQYKQWMLYMNAGFSALFCLLYDQPICIN